MTTDVTAVSGTREQAETQIGILASEICRPGRGHSQRFPSVLHFVPTGARPLS